MEDAEQQREGSAHLRNAAKIDDNQPAIVEALRRCGVSVENIKQPVDLLCWCRGETFLLEVKNSFGKNTLTKEQVEFIARWPGKVHVVRTPEEALRAVIGDY